MRLARPRSAGSLPRPFSSTSTARAARRGSAASPRRRPRSASPPRPDTAISPPPRRASSPLAWRFPLRRRCATPRTRPTTSSWPPQAFLPAAQPLLERRESQGLSTRAVSLEEIASVFGKGEASAEAIHEFLAFAYHSWSQPSPRYVLLLGGSSFDPRNFTGRSRPAPLPFLATKTSFLLTASDPLLAAVNGDDALPDLALGRLPANTLEEAEALVAKLLAWEDSRQGLDGRAVLVADNPDAGGAFDAGRRRHRAELPRLARDAGPQDLRARRVDAPGDPLGLRRGRLARELRRPRRRRDLGLRERPQLLGPAGAAGPVRPAPAPDAELPQRLLRRRRASTPSPRRFLKVARPRRHRLRLPDRPLGRRPGARLPPRAHGRDHVRAPRTPR